MIEHFENAAKYADVTGQKYNVTIDLSITIEGVKITCRDDMKSKERVLPWVQLNSERFPGEALKFFIRNTVWGLISI